MISRSSSEVGEHRSGGGFRDLLQESQRVTDLLPLEEPLAADPERDAGLGQRRFDRRDLGVDPDEDRDLGGLGHAGPQGTGGLGIPDQPADRGHDRRELSVAVGKSPDRGCLPGRHRGDQLLSTALGRQQSIGEREDLG